MPLEEDDAHIYKGKGLILHFGKGQIEKNQTFMYFKVFLHLSEHILVRHFKSYPQVKKYACEQSDKPIQYYWCLQI